MIISLLFACTDKEAQAEIDVLNQQVLEQKVLIDYQNRQFDELVARMETLETQMNNISGGYTLGELSIRIEDNAAGIAGQDISIYNLESRTTDLEGSYVSVQDIDLYARKTWVEQQGYATQSDVNNNEVTLSTQNTSINDNENNITLLLSQVSSIQNDYVQNASLNNYALQSWVLGQGFATESYVSTYPFALQTDLDSANEYVSTVETRVTDLEDNAISLPDLTPYATKEWVEEQEYASEQMSALSQYLSIDTTNHDIMFTGANLHIQSGGDATDDNIETTGSLTGLGNLIIGYNANDTDDRTGSHNIIVGDLHSYTSYGALVVGNDNESSAPHASVLSGTKNKSSQQYATVVGGNNNLSDGVGAHISGGSYGFISEDHGSIFGGKLNSVSGKYGSIIGGTSNTAVGELSTVLGGTSSSAEGTSALVSGENNVAQGDHSLILGGSGNTTTGSYSAILSGENNTASGSHASISAGYNNLASGDYSSVSAGRNNTASSLGATVSGGLTNTASGAHSSVTGGEENEASGGAASISGGRYNTASGSYTMHAGGESLTLSNDYAYSAVNVPDLENYVQVDTVNHSITFTGANVFVQSGSGYTDDDYSTTGSLTGLGNLIIGYDENIGTDTKTGTHNLVVGPHHTYTSYASILFGYDNSSTGSYGIVGGKQNEASARNNCILGGEGHQTSQYGACVLGGRDNVIEGLYVSILGGDSNLISEDYSSIVGGEANIANGAYSSILGGNANTTSEEHETTP